MIRAVKIKNFKSLRDVDIGLGKFNVIIGPNASGKSNFLDSLVFLSQTARMSVESTLSIRGGFEHVVFGGEKKAGIGISVEFSLEEEIHTYEITIGSEGILAESLSPNLIFRERKGGRSEVLMEVGRATGIFPPAFHSLLWNAGNMHSLPKYHDYINSWRSYSFSTSAMKTTVPARKYFDLSSNGDNLAQVLLSMRSERLELFFQVENILKQGIPEIDKLLAPLDGSGATHIAVRVKGFGDYQFDYYQLSDGTLKLLAYIVAVTSPEPKLVCFEEPENFIHPRLLELLVEILKKSDKQVVLSTHSPYLLDHVEPEDVIIFEKLEGETKVSRMENMELIKKHLKDIGLGALWYSGEVGGVP